MYECMCACGCVAVSTYLDSVNCHRSRSLLAIHSKPQLCTRPALKPGETYLVFAIKIMTKGKDHGMQINSDNRREVKEMEQSKRTNEMVQTIAPLYLKQKKSFGI